MGFNSGFKGLMSLLLIAETASQNQFPYTAIIMHNSASKYPTVFATKFGFHTVNPIHRYYQPANYIKIKLSLPTGH